MNRIALVLALLSLTVACSKPSPDELLVRGNDYASKNQIAEAIVQYRLAIQADPNRGDVRMKLSDALLREKQGAAATREAVLAADLLPDNFDAQMKAGALLLLSGLFEDAKTRAERALAIKDKHVDALVLLGNALAGLKDLEGAMAEYQEALVLNPTGEELYANVGAIQFIRGQRKEAEEAFRKAVAVAPASVPARLALASFLWASSRLPEAEGVLKDALKINASDLTANRALASFYVSTGRAIDAEPLFKSIVDSTKTDAARLALADFYLSLKRYEDAKALLLPLSQSGEAVGPASLRLVSIEITSGNREAAAALLKSLKDKLPRFGPARVLEARLLLDDGKLDEAAAAAASVIKDEPSTTAAGDAHMIVGTVQANRDHLDDAVRHYEEALRLQPRAIDAQIALAQIHLQLGNPSKAETYAKQVLAVQPRHPLARAAQVRAQLMRNDVTTAAIELAALEKEFPNTVPVMLLVAARDVTAGRLDAARSTYTKILATAPNNLEALEGIGMIDLRAGRKKEAVNRIEAALTRVSPGSDLYIIAARTHLTVGNAPRAEELLKLAIDREPARINAYGLLGQVYANQNRLAEAQAQFKALLERNPRSVPASTMLGMILEAKRELPAAEEQYLKTIAMEPEAAVASNNLAWLFVSSNRNLEQALQLAQTALRTLPEEPHVNDTIGWIYYRKGFFPEAIRHLELSLKRDASDPSVHYHLGMAYVGGAEPEKARRSLEKALSINPSFDGASEARKTLATLVR